MKFWGDTRSQSVQVGVVLLFGVAVIAFSTYQASIIPSQNREIEFNHFEEVRNDMTDVRNSILTTGQSDIEQHPSVILGTNYPARVAGRNPPPVFATVQTSDAYNITITNESGAKVEIPTRFLEYDPEYNQLRSGSTWYENSILYFDERQQGGGIVIIEEQDLNAGGPTLRITAIQGEMRASGTNRITLDLYPAENITADEIPNGDLSIEIPTRLSAGEYWDSAFSDAPSGMYQGIDETSYSDSSSVYGLKLAIDTSRSASELQVNTVGIQSEPSNNPQKQNIGAGTSGSDGNVDDGEGGSGDPLPANDVSFNDTNGNGVYDDDVDGDTYSEQDLTSGFDQSGVDLVIAEDTSGSSDFDISADSITVQSDSTLDSSDGKITLESYNGPTTVSGSLTAKNTINISTSSNNIDVTGGSVDTKNGKITLTSDSGGNINISDGSLTSKNTIEVTTSGGGDIDGSMGTINTNNGKVTLKTDSGGDINVAGGSISSKNEIKIETSGTGNIDVSSGLVESTNGKVSYITSDISEIDLRSTIMRSKNGAFANSNNDATIYVDDSVIEVSNSGDSATLTARGKIVGEPEKGTVN